MDEDTYCRIIMDTCAVETKPKTEVTTIFLVLGCICTAHRQLEVVKLFKAMAGAREDLHIIFAITNDTCDSVDSYRSRFLQEASGDPRIELLNIRHNLEEVMSRCNVLLCAPYVFSTLISIYEAMSCGVCIVTPNWNGISEIIEDGVNGLITPFDNEAALNEKMKLLVDNPDLVKTMGDNARVKFHSKFHVTCMIEAYCNLIFEVAPPVVLIDMDTTIWELNEDLIYSWKDRCKRNCNNNYFYLVDESNIASASSATSFSAPIEFAGDMNTDDDYFMKLQSKAGAIEALKEMKAAGLRVILFSVPMLSSSSCFQEKYAWVANNLGDDWCNNLIIGSDKV